MHKITTGLLTLVIVAGMGAFAWKACATDEPAADQAAPAQPADAAAPAAGAAAGGGGECCKPGDTTPPLDLIKATPKGRIA